MSNKSTEAENRENYLFSLRIILTNGYAKYLRQRGILIAGPNGELMKCQLRRKEEGWVELGPHHQRRLRKRKMFPGRFSLATGESLDGFVGWRIVSNTAENLESARVQAIGRLFRSTFRRVAAAAAPTYAAMLTSLERLPRGATADLERLVRAFLGLNESERKALIAMMKADVG